MAPMSFAIRGLSLAKKPVRQIDKASVVPKLSQTGVSVKVASDGACEIDLDQAEDTALIHPCGAGEAFELRWNSRRKVGNFLYIAKAWRDWRGRRHFRVQSHRIFDDGVIWWRFIHYESVNGKDVIPVPDKNRLMEVAIPPANETVADGKA